MNYILDGHEPKECANIREWAEWFEKGDRVVAQETLPSGIRVSTVFLGIDHSFGIGPPLLFETMIFGGPHDQYQERYATWLEAEVGHQAALLLARDQRN